MLSGLGLVRHVAPSYQHVVRVVGEDVDCQLPFGLHEGEQPGVLVKLQLIKIISRAL